jgi:type II secretory pathway component PulF
MTEKRQTSQGYIIRILQHFATKLRNITNFFDALSSCDEIFVQTCLDQNFTQKGKGLLGYYSSRLVSVCAFFFVTVVPRVEKIFPGWKNMFSGVTLLF